jgi:glycerophosphoryl diester phosphodiesterase
MFGMTVRGLDHPYFSLPTPWLIAHRGGSLEAPENTLVAFDRAAALGADVIETDVRLSRDEVVMVFHDPDTFRITGVQGTIEDRTAAEIEQLDAAFWFEQDGAFPWRGKGVRVPRLADVLARFPTLRFNIEAKGKGRRLAKRLAQVLEAAGRQGSVCVGAERALQAWRLAHRLPGYARFLPAWAAGLHYFAARGWLPGFLAPGGFDLAALPARQYGLQVAREDVIAWFHGRGMAVQYWTIDREEEMKLLLKWGADGIMSDLPTLLRQVLGR